MAKWAEMKLARWLAKMEREVGGLAGGLGVSQNGFSSMSLNEEQEERLKRNPANARNDDCMQNISHMQAL